VTTPYSEELAGIKVDTSGPKPPKIIVKGKKYRKPGKKGRKGKVVKNTYTGKVRVRFVGKPDRTLPDGSAGAGLNRKSVPKTRVIKKKGRTVIKVKTRDTLGNTSKTVRKVIKIKKFKKAGKRGKK